MKVISLLFLVNKKEHSYWLFLILWVLCFFVEMFKVSLFKVVCNEEGKALTKLRARGAGLFYIMLL